jgi:hypothetical protein
VVLLLLTLEVEQVEVILELLIYQAELAVAEMAVEVEVFQVMQPLTMDLEEAEEVETLEVVEVYLAEQ